jgi:aspartate kinase
VGFLWRNFSSPEPRREIMNEADCERQGAEIPVATVVMKFGGTSLEDPAAIRRAIQLVENSRGHPVVVASALASVTDQLLEAATVAAQGQLPLALESVQQLERRHLGMASELVGDASYASLEEQLRRDFALLRELARNIASSGELSARLQDHFLGVGESLASKIVHVGTTAGQRGPQPGGRQLRRHCPPRKTLNGRRIPPHRL